MKKYEIKAFPKVINHLWYWHWEKPVKNVYLNCTKHNQPNKFTLQYDNGRWYIGYIYDNSWNEEISTSHKSLEIAQKQLENKLKEAFKQKISKDGQFEGNLFKISVK